MYLTKSDFKACYDCRTKLFYRKNKYPSASDDDEYLRFLADGGFMVELIAKAQHPGGIDLVDIRDPKKSWEETKVLLTRDEVTIFEAGIIHEKFHVRIDILRKRRGVLELIEVKSSGVEDDADDSDSPFLNKKGTGVISRWKQYLTDVAFQVHVLQLAFPSLEVRPFLCVVNKSAVATEMETLGNFKLSKDKTKPKSRPQITYARDISELAKSSILTTRPVGNELSFVRDEVVRKADELAALIVDGKISRVQEPIDELYAVCRNCDYRVESDRSGFGECWGALAQVPAHILDLHRVGQIASGGEPDPVTRLLRGGQASYLNLREDELGNGNSYTIRRQMQWNGFRTQLEFLPHALTEELRSHQTTPGWPLYFVDFEACDIALPHHAGLHPFERVAFQWSCHILHENGELSHQEWLNDEREFPNFAFARSLRKCLGDSGTVYVWSSYEQVTLRKVIEQLTTWIERDPVHAVKVAGAGDVAELHELAQWIEALLGPEEKGKRISPRIRDLHKLALEHYFHPRMEGRTSIKVVLPSVWESNPKLNAHACFRGYLRLDEQGRPANPYSSLPALPFGDDEEEDNAVREGTGAIRVYQDLVFTDDATNEERMARKGLLLQYCRLDTAAMVMIWSHWLGSYEFRATS